ncbi:hypothetical protein [Bosea sp. NBC_00550]|jgi:hypothetical protein|uniref:hypothetical protein n=1 Tax=Bosea sp. NBC_00550 TaxID=2969621 RepID=UPI00222F1381|nr:hypothetical protein [Bosea sp. NBC_00550]UZF95622.1 hypothetical protein NWE53_29640 [Bosea sp. NBC_00550]
MAARDRFPGRPLAGLGTRRRPGQKTAALPEPPPYAQLQQNPDYSYFADPHVQARFAAAMRIRATIPTADLQAALQGEQGN